MQGVEKKATQKFDKNLKTQKIVAIPRKKGLTVRGYAVYVGVRSVYCSFFLTIMTSSLRIIGVLLLGLAFSGCPPAPESVQATLPENLGIVINKYTNGFWIRQMGTAEGDTVELLVTQKALDARGIFPIFICSCFFYQ